SQPPLLSASPLPAPSPYTEQSGSPTEHREPASCPISPVRTTRRVPRSRPPPVPGTYAMALRPSSIPLRVPLSAPPESSLPEVPDPESDRARAASPIVARLLANAVTDPSFDSAAASALVAELLDLAAACRTYVDEVPPPGANIVDSITPFLQGGLHEEIWLRRSPGFTGSFPAGTQCSLRRPVYCLRQAPREWHDTLRTTLVALGFAPSTADPSLFLCTDTSLPPFYVLVYIDDLVFATADTEALTLVKSELQKRHACTDLGELRSYLGLQITRDKARRTSTLTQSHMVHQSVESSGPYLELVGCLMYLMTCTRPDLAYPLSLLARYVAPGMGLVLGGRGSVVLTGHADTSWADDSATQRSPQGYTFSLGAMAAQELCWLTYLLTDLGEQPRSPPVLYVDNKAMIALCQEHRLEHKTKHIALRYFLARELHQRGQLRLAYVATRANTADVFTKALPPGDHQRFSTVLGLLALLFLTGLVGDASVFWVWGSCAFVCDSSTDKLSARAILCVFLGFSPDALGWQFYHPTLRRVLPSQDVMFDESVPFYRLFPYRSAPPPPPPLFLAPGSSPVDPLPPQGPAPLGVSQVDPLLGTMAVEVAVDSGAARGAASGGAASGGAEPWGAESEGARSGGAEPGGAEPGGAEPAGVEPGGAEPEGVERGGAEPEGVEPGGTDYEGAEFGGAEPQGTASSGGPAAAGAGGYAAGDSGVGGFGATHLGGAGVTSRVRGTGGAAATGPGGARTRGTGSGTGSARTGSVRGAGARGAGAGDPVEHGGAGVRGAGAGGTGAGGAGAGGVGSGDTGEVGAGTGGSGAGGAGAVGAGAGNTGALVLGARGGGAGGSLSGGIGVGGTVRPRPYFVPLLQQKWLQPPSPLPAPSPYNEQTGGLTERREPASRLASLVRAVRIGRRVPRPRPPLVPGTHAMALRPSYVPLRVPWPPPPASSIPAIPDPESDRARAASRTVSCLLAFVVTDPESDRARAAASAEMSASPLSVRSECVLGTDVLEDKQEDFECLAAAVPCFASMLLAPEGDPDAPDISTPRSYTEAISDPPSRMNIVDGMWIFRVMRLPSSLPAFKARYVARGFSVTTSCTLWTSAQLSCRAACTRRSGFAAHLASLGRFLQVPSGASGGQSTVSARHLASGTTHSGLHTSLPTFYVLVYVDNLVFATAHTEALTLVNSELQKRPTCTDLGELRSYLGLQITWDRAWRTISLTQSHMVHQVLQRFVFQFSSPQPTPLSIDHSLSAPPSDESVELSGPYPKLVGCHITTGMGLVLGGRGPVVLTGHADASWVDDSAVQRSSQGYGSVSWRSTHSSLVLSSSCEAEIYAGALAAQELRWLTYLLTDLGEQLRLPPVLVSQFDHVFGAAPAPPTTADVSTRSQWLSRDATARLAIRNHLPVAECTHFGQHRTAQALYDAVVARYSSPATAALGRLLLPYLFPELSAFATVADLVTHLRTSDARYRCADHFLTLDPTSLTVDLLEQHLLAAETCAVAVGAARGTPRSPFFEGCFPSPLSPSLASAAAADVSVTEDVGAALTSAKRRSSKGKGGRGGGGGSGGGGSGIGSDGGGSGGGGGGSGGGGGGGTGSGSGGSGGSGGGGGGSGGSGGGWTGIGRSGHRRGGPGGGQRQQQQRRSETQSPQQLREWLTCGKFHTEHRIFSHLEDAWRAEFGDDVDFPHRTDLFRSGVAIFDLDYDAIISAMYALYFSAEGDCYRCVPPDPAIAAAALGASVSGTPPGTVPAQALHTFTLDSGASRCFFHDSTSLTPLPTPVPVRLADPSKGPVVARSSTVLPCLAVPSGSLSGLHLPSFSTNLGQVCTPWLPSLLRLLCGTTAWVTPPFHAFVACTPGFSSLVYPSLCLPSRPRLPRHAFLASRGGSAHDDRVGGAGATGAGAVDSGAGGAGGRVRPRPYFVPLLKKVLCVPSSTGLHPPFLCPPPDQSQLPLQPASPLRAPSPYTEQSDGLTERRELASRPVSPVRIAHRAPRSSPPPVPGTHSVAASALVAELLDFAAACRLNYATALVAESVSASPPSVGGECALGTDVLEDKQEDFECLAAAGEAATGFSTCLQGVCTDYMLHSLDFSTTFLQGSLHEEIWLRRPPGFTGTFPAGTQWSLRWPVYGLRQAPREWHDTRRTTLPALGFAPSTADPTLFLRTDTSLPSFYILVYIDDLVFAIVDTEALTLVKSELQKRHTCTDLGPSALQLLSAPASDESVEPSVPYPELVGCLMYLMTCTRPDLAYPLSLLARYVALVRQAWGLCLEDGVELFSLVTQTPPGSSCEAETYAWALAAQKLRWLTYLLLDLGDQPRSPPVLYVENKAMISLCQEHRLEHRTKNIALRYFLARELQQRGQLCLAYVATWANTADVFTKALPPGDHQCFSIVLGLVPTLPHLLTA
ncbi:unnamed protein product, partial [Closterium sp. NIES-53]